MYQQKDLFRGNLYTMKHVYTRLMLKDARNTSRHQWAEECSKEGLVTT